MKSFLITFFSFMVLHSFAQTVPTKYGFDYFTVYDYKKSEKDTLVSTKELNYSNSKDSTYVIQVYLENNIAKKIFLVDFKNLKMYEFEVNKNITDYSDVSFLKIKNNYKYSLDNCLEKSKYFYEVDYKNQAAGSIVINSFKNQDRKKLVDTFFLETVPSAIANNQQYNFSPLINSLWCNKFKLKNKGIIKSAYFIKKGKKEHIRKLEDIYKIEFTLTVDSKI